MLHPRWSDALLLIVLACGGLIGCSAEPAEQTSTVEREQIRKQQINRASRESGAK